MVLQRPAGDPFGSQAPLFYGPIQQGKDGWNAAFFCGSNAVLRREALMQLGVRHYVRELEQRVSAGAAGWPSGCCARPSAGCRPAESAGSHGALSELQAGDTPGTRRAARHGIDPGGHLGVSAPGRGGVAPAGERRPRARSRPSCEIPGRGGRRPGASTASCTGWTTTRCSTHCRGATPRRWRAIAAVRELLLSRRRRPRRRGAAGHAAGAHLGDRGHGDRDAPARGGLALGLPPRDPGARPGARGSAHVAAAAAALGTGHDSR